jgi:hypothetical protein
MKISNFIGRQLSRLKMGQSYYMIVVSTITALGIVKLVWASMPNWMLFTLFPIALFGAFFLGYLMDKSNVTALDHRKTLDMQARYVNVADLKSYEFWMVVMNVFFKWMTSIQDGKPLDRDEIEKEYHKFLKRWQPSSEEK